MATYFDKMEALATRQGGYFYPWRSTLGEGDGEAAYTALVEAHLAAGLTVLEAGCGHGPDIGRFAHGVGRYVAYDAIPSFIGKAEAEVRARGLRNVELVVADSSAGANDGAARAPVEAGSVDLAISRRGPTNWIADARRFARPGAILMQLNPLDGPAPAWNAELPEGLRIQPTGEDISSRIAEQLARGDLVLHSAWTFDVPEHLPTVRDLHAYLTFLLTPDDSLSLEATTPALQTVFDRHAGDQGLEVRQRRYLWKAVVD